MPLDKSGTKESVSNNIRAERAAGKPQAQAVAIALDVARRARRAKGGAVHVGPIKGDMPGRTDVHEMAVPDGAYVLSADVISHLGENNTDAGLKTAHALFGEGGMHDEPTRRKSGGKASAEKPVECITAGGEYVIPPSVVRNIGNGDLDLGHKILDHYSMAVRQDHIKTLASLPEPAKD